ncbi:MAG: DEAD/DEAH box helicase [Acidimicrobiaceae bacterium]|nr:DEAD/DEAH box helicase [Acidimicrobiaceae bacterium]
MHRLLQGDVGAGKTLVAVSAMLTAVQGGHQGALMAPTEVLAEQHATGVRRLLDGVTVPDPGNLFGDRPLRVELLTNRITGGDRRDVLAGLADGTVDIAIGTHALIQEGVQFHSLGVVVGRRAAPLRGRAARGPAGQGRRRRGARRAGDDRHADPSYGRDDRVRRPRCERARRATAGSHAHRHEVGQRAADGARCVGHRARRGRRRSAGVRGVPAHRGEREAGGGQRTGDVRTAASRRAAGLAHRVAARSDAVVGEGGRDGCVPSRRHRRARGHHRHRGRRRRGQRNRDGHHRCRPVRHRPVASAARPSGPWRARIHVLAGHPAGGGQQPAGRGAGCHHRRLRARRGRPRPAR